MLSFWLRADTAGPSIVLRIDALGLGIADGPARLRLILDDGSAVLRDAVASGGRIAIAPDLPRPWMRRIERA